MRTSKESSLHSDDFCASDDFAASYQSDKDAGQRQGGNQGGFGKTQHETGRQPGTGHGEAGRSNQNPSRKDDQNKR